MIEFIGEDPTRAGLRETPDRVVRAWRELYRGVGVSTEEAGKLIKMFRCDTRSYEPVVLRGIAYASVCEHHLLPYTGKMSVAYLARGGREVIGLSKIPRVIALLAAKPSVQEQLTAEVAHTLAPFTDGVFVMADAEHSCLHIRGAKTHAVMTTRAYAGMDKDDAEKYALLASAITGGYTQAQPCAAPQTQERGAR